MGRSNKMKKLRGSRGFRTGPSLTGSGTSSKDACDLMVLAPKSTSKLKCQLLVKELQDRLASTGFTHMALTHTIYGRPRPTEDRAETAIPVSLWKAQTSSERNLSTEKERNASVSSGKKRKLADATDCGGSDDELKPTKINVLRRLHMVMENVSDAGVFLANGLHSELLNEYDLVSISPTNDATFQSACASATMTDIVTLDYTGRGLRLPYRIRSSDVRAAIDRGAAFEIPLAPALLHLKQRKALVHACRELQNSSLGLRPRIIISSGDRTLDGSDVGAMALRMPGDLSNLCKVVMQFDETISGRAVGAAAIEAIRKGAERRLGKSTPSKVSLMSQRDLQRLVTTNNGLHPVTKATSHQKVESPAESDGRGVSISEQLEHVEDNDHDGVEDGFITL